jgi:hypothetical protein
MSSLGNLFPDLFQDGLPPEAIIVAAGMFFSN